MGWLSLATGLLLHKWALESFLAADGKIGSPRFTMVIAAFQLTWIVFGVALLWHQKRHVPAALKTLARILVGGSLLVGIYGNLRAQGILDPYRELRASWDEVTAAEELLLELTPKLDRLTTSVENLGLPDLGSRRLFSEQVSVRDLTTVLSATEQIDSVAVEVVERAIATQTTDLASNNLNLWRPLLDNVEYFEHAKFKMVEGRFIDDSSDLYVTHVHFQGLARTKVKRWVAVDIDLSLRWQLPAAKESSWFIAEWHTLRWSTQEAPERLFAEVLDDALDDPAVLTRARRSIHEERLREYFADPDKITSAFPYFMTSSADLHPGVSVVDLDRDGYDDLYVMPRWGANLFFRNRGDGTFEETASELGLDVVDHTSSAIFADFDNDGDADVVLGRTLERSLYLVNEEGRFVDRSSTHVDQPLPCLASSVSAVDYNADGLLDVYISTYGAVMQSYLLNDPGELVAKCLPEADRQRWLELASTEHLIMDNFGPPNVMLRNRGGGRFEAVRLMPDLYRNTFQSTWADYDLDGDADVYLANDFAPNNLLRNEGDGHFSDVTVETGTADVGFGMGASWGDYDHDGRPDLYVSNMYSKAGRRITRDMPQIDSRLPIMSRGNSLFRNAANGFEKRSGDTPDALHVEKAGWSWGGQLADLDNDGFLDVYALSGFFTAPAPFELPVDL